MKKMMKSRSRSEIDEQVGVDQEGDFYIRWIPVAMPMKINTEIKDAILAVHENCIYAYLCYSC